MNATVRINVHLCGIASAYESFERSERKREPYLFTTSRPQGSRYNQQKKHIADAVEWLRQNSVYKPRIFVATSPGLISSADEKPLIQKFCHNLRNGYDCREYIWVREYTKKGFPHFHFVADVDQFDPVQLSLYWSGLFGVSAKNCIRLGTRPTPGRKRKFWVDGPRMAFYMSKYIGKGFTPKEKLEMFDRQRVRMFGQSQTLSKIGPLVYEQRIDSPEYALKKEKKFVVMDSDYVDKFYYQKETLPPRTFNPNSYSWKWTGHGNTYSGIPKKWAKKPKK